jgi:predicted short-subunit dehydrogenase-like oxidoreductase (DUF2520 family)
MKVVIIGSGNVATVLGRKIKERGTEIIQVISKTEKHAKALADVLRASYATNLSGIDTAAELYLIAVSDQQIDSVARQLPRMKGIVVHTAGSVNKDVLKDVASNYGVMYPLQTLNKHVDTLPVIPIILDGNSEQVRHTLFDFAGTWTPIVAFANDEQRLSTHIAAVIANNFTNHLMALTEDFCNKEGVDFKLLIPLINETVNKLGTLSPAILQTGPAVRGDISTIDKHLQLLNRQPALRKLYLKLTESIIVQSKLNAIDI